MRLLFRIFTSALLFLGYVGLTIAAVVSFVVTDRQTLLTSFEEADVYEQLVPVLIEETIKDQQDSDLLDGEETIPFDDPEIRRIIEETISGSVVRNSFTTIINGTFDWLDGTTQELFFEVDLTAVRDSLVRSIAAHIADEVAARPECTSAIEAQYDDVFDISCRPPGFSPESINDEIEQKLTDVDEFEDLKITPEVIKGEDEQPISEQYADAPEIYASVRSGFIPMLAVFFVVAGLFMLARLPWSQALHKLGKQLLIMSLLTLTPVAIAYFLLPGVVESSSVDSEAQKLAAEVVQAYVGKVMTFLAAFCLSTASISIAILLVHHYVLGRHESSNS